MEIVHRIEDLVRIPKGRPRPVPKDKSHLATFFLSIVVIFIALVFWVVAMKSWSGDIKTRYIDLSERSARGCLTTKCGDELAIDAARLKYEMEHRPWYVPKW